MTTHSWPCEANEGGKCNCEVQANFLQVGPQIKCSHCEPDKYAVAPIPCRCTCHRPSKDTREEWINDRLEEIGDSYDKCAYCWKPDVIGKAALLSRLSHHYRDLVALAKKEERERCKEILSKYIEENRHKVERIDRYVLDQLLQVLDQQ